jgi:hypothetical protein
VPQRIARIVPQWIARIVPRRIARIVPQRDAPQRIVPQHQTENILPMMKYKPEIHHRRSIRLKEHDYTADDAYFVTMVTFQRDCLFAEIHDGKIILSAIVQIA